MNKVQTQKLPDGVVYIEPVTSTRTFPSISAYWFRDDVLVDRGSGWIAIQDALEWARPRAPEVLVTVKRLVQREKYVRVDGLPIRVKTSPVQNESIHRHADPIASDPGDSSFSAPLQGYGGEVRIIDEYPEEFVAGNLGFTADWELLENEHLTLRERVGPAWPGDIDRAISWARERASIVVVCSGPPHWAYLSAGARALDELEFPAWDDVVDRSDPSGGELKSWATLTPIPGRTFSDDERDR